MAHSEQDIAYMFDTISPRYDFLNRLLSVGQDQRWRAALIKRIPECPGGTYVDVATGTGDVILAASQARPSYTRFIGTDISTKMLDLASQKSQSTPSSIEYKKMSAERMDMPTRSVDCISIAFGLRNVVNPPQALREFCRILKPSSKLLILEFFEPTQGIMARSFQFYFHHILPKIGALFSKKSAYSYLPESVTRFYSLEELCQLIREEGFVVSETKKFVFGACCLIVADKIDHFEDNQ